MLNVGSIAPDFNLQSTTGETISLSSYCGKQAVVLVFYPGDQTPVCTAQLCEFRDDYDEFTSKGMSVLGLNPASSSSHEKFVARFKFPFPLLVDVDGLVAKQYGVKGFLLVKRSVFVVDRSGIIVYASKGKPSPNEILKSI